MEKAHRITLKQNRELIVQDLDVKYVIDYLIEKDAITDENYQLILSHPTTQGQARQLLDILPKRGPKAFNAFLDSLKRDYEHIWEALENNGRSSPDSALSSESYKDILMRGGVPTHPNSVERNQMGPTIAALRELKKGGYVVLHGMPGRGKSVIAAETLWRNQDLVNNYFQDGVFWVKVGDVQPDQLLSRFRALCTKLDHQPLPNDIEEGQEILRKLLSDKYENCLLVLDDVWKPEVVRAFQLPVKIMITTQDSAIMDVINKLCYTLIDCQEGFSQKESLGFFSNTLQINESELPEEASQIHDAAKGNPMIISLIASLINQTKIKRSSDRWQYYLTNLKNRRYGKIIRQSSYDHSGILPAVKMSIDALDSDLRDKYEHLVVFLDDDMIPTSALEKLWGLDQYEVEDVMMKLVRKSLASSEWDSIQESTLYSFHDLHLVYLRSQYEETEDGDHQLKQLHRSFVNKYLETVQFERFEELENDNYILTHLAYHLHKAEMFEYFPKIFLNLLYIEKVIKEFGTAGILHDYKRYRSLIEKGHEEEFEDMEEFCRTSGVVMCANEDVDIIQLGLGQPAKCKVFQKAKTLADSEENTYYLEWTNREGVNSRTKATVMHRDKEAHDIRFLPDFRVATVTGDGVIKVWDWVSGEVLQRLRGHDGSVNCISYGGCEGSTLCSGGKDATVKFWKLDPLPEPEAEQDKLHVHRRSVMKKSPKSTQPETWNTVRFFQKDDSINTIKVNVSTDKDMNEVTAIDWRPGTLQIAVGTRSGTIIVYENLKEKYRISRHNEVVNALAYNQTGSMIALACDDTTITVWDSDTGDYRADIRYHCIRVIGLAWLGSLDKLVSISQDDLVVWENPGTGADVNALTRNRGASWHCVAANDRIIAAGTITEKLVVLFCVKTRQVVAALTGQTSHLVNLSFITAQGEDDDYGDQDGEDQDEVLLAGLSEQMLIVWSVDNVEYDAVDPELLPLGPQHHTRWLPAGKFMAGNKNLKRIKADQGVLTGRGTGHKLEDAITTAPDDRNRITILENGKRVIHSEPEQEEITAIRLSTDCDYVVYGTALGHIKKFMLIKGQLNNSIQVMTEKHQSPIISLKITKSDIIVSGGNDHLVKIFHPDGEVFTCSGHQTCVRDVELICGESKVLSCDREGIMRIWDINTGLEIMELLQGYTSFSTCLDVWEGEQDSLAAVGGVTGGVSIISLNTGKCLIKISENGPEVRKARFGPSGTFLATGHDSGEVQVWDVSTGRSILTSPLQLHSSWVKDLAISQDGKKMLTVGDRLVWWSLEYLAKPQPQSAGPKRKLSLPNRSRRTSESRSNASSIHEDNLDGTHLANLSTLSKLSNSIAYTHPPKFVLAAAADSFGGAGSSSPTSPSAQSTPPPIKSPLLPPMSPLRRQKLPISGSTQKRPNSLNLENLKSPNSPASNKKDRKTGRGRQKELLQTFDMKGSCADTIFVNKDFSEFVTVDDAGILYILKEYKPTP